MIQLTFGLLFYHIITCPLSLPSSIIQKKVSINVAGSTWLESNAMTAGTAMVSWWWLIFFHHENTKVHSSISYPLGKEAPLLFTKYTTNLALNYCKVPVKKGFLRKVKGPSTFVDHHFSL